jgi:hypothetical protein
VFTLKELITQNDHRPTHTEPAIDSSTGALSVDPTHSFAFELEHRIFPSYGNLHIHEVAHRDTASRSFFAWTRLRIELGNRIFVMPSCMRQLRIMSSIVRFFHCLIPTLHCRNPLFLYSSSLLTLRTYARLRPLDSD